MKSLNNYIIEKLADFSEWIDSFTTSDSYSNSLRFLHPEKDKQLIEEFINTKECKKPLYRASYIDHGRLWNTPEGGTCYEPVLSFSEAEDWIDILNKTHAINDELSGDSGLIMKIILHKNSKSLNIDKYSRFQGQKEWIACGKFKVLKKTITKEIVLNKDIDNDNKSFMSNPKADIKFDLHTIEIEQVFDEDLFDIFRKLYDISPNKKQEEYEEYMKKRHDISEEELVGIIKYYRNKSITSAEYKNWEKEGIHITKEYLTNELAKRIYDDYIKLDLDFNRYNPISYNMVYTIAHKYNIKMNGAKKYGFPNLDFPETIE